MKNKIIKFITLTFLAFMFKYFYSNFILKGSIQGVYVNNNYDSEQFLVEIPYIKDTLYLHKNNKFESSYWGNGNYEIKYSLKGTKISLIYQYSDGKGEFNSSIERPLIGNLRIILNRDLEHYFEKFKNQP